MSDTKGLLKDRYCGILALNPLLGSSSASRLAMNGAQIGQKIPVRFPDSRIVASALDVPMKDHTFSIKAPVDLTIKSVIVNTVGYTQTDITGSEDQEVPITHSVIYEDIITKEIGIIEIPRYHSLDPYLGFTYIQLRNLSVGDNLNAGDIIADSPGALSDEYRYTSLLNVAFCSRAGTAEDAVLVNEDCLGRLEYDNFYEYTIKLGENETLLNYWGDVDRVQTVPLVGQRIAPNGIIAVKREITLDNMLAKGTPRAMSEVDHAGGDVVYQTSSDGDAVVIGVEVLRNTRTKSVNPDNVYESQLNSLANNTSTYAKRIVDEYIRLSTLQKKAGKAGKPTDEFNSILLAYVTQFGLEKFGITPPKLIDKKVDISPYTIKITVRSRRKPYIGSKFTDMFASKGINSRIVPASQMPKDQYGRVADICKSPDSVVSRNIPGELHDHYLGNCSDLLSRTLCDYLGIWDLNSQQSGGKKPSLKRIRKRLKVLSYEDNGSAIINALWKIVEFYEVIYGENYPIPLKTTLENYLNTGSPEDHDSLIKYLEESLYWGPQIILSADFVSKVGIVNIVNRLKDSIFAPVIGTISYYDDDGEFQVSDAPVMVAPMSVMILEKDGSAASAAPSVRLQSMRMTSTHTKADKQTSPLPEKNVAFMALDNTVILSSIIGERGVAEMLDRFNNVDARQERARMILESDRPMGEETLVDRNMIPYSSTALQQLQHTLSCFGAELIYKPE